MTDRYSVRQSDDGRFGVWDHAVNGWHGPADLDEVDALRRAAARNVEISSSDSPRRTVDPPKSVTIVFGEQKLRGVLDAWVRESGQWWGHVTIGTRDGWYPAFALRQA